MHGHLHWVLVHNLIRYIKTSSVGGGGGECAARLFILFFFPCSADHERGRPPCKVAFFGLATNGMLRRSGCVCVCVFFPFILDIKFVGRTSRGHTGGRSHRISHPPSFCGACLNFSREKDSAIPFPRRP